MIKNQHGVTLIELMISMTLGLALIAGIGQLFVQSQRSFRLQQNVSDITDDGAFILESLAKGILLAGFSESNNAFSADIDVSPVTGIPAINLDASKFINGTDSQLVYRFELGASNLNVNTGSELDNFVGTSSMTGNEGDIITVRIYKKNDTDGVPVLYSKVKKNSDSPENAEPLISNVEKLVFKYGIRFKECKRGSDNKCVFPIKRMPENDSFYYTNATDLENLPPVTNENNWMIFAVKVFLVLRSSENNVVRNKMSYVVDGETITATDNRLYKVFSKTIYLRTGDSS